MKVKCRHKPRHKSNFECQFYAATKGKYGYERVRIPYTLHCEYVPDWLVGATDFIETTGKLDGAKRRKLLALRAQYPRLVIRLCFQRNNKLNKRSKTTYMQWAQKHGFPASIFPNLPF